MKGYEATMHGPLWGEFMGTMVLVLLGDGVVANVLLKKSKGEGAGWIVIATGWGLGVTAGIFAAIACGSRVPTKTTEPLSCSSVE
jgi:glycerol uptake facilitator protein